MSKSNEILIDSWIVSALGLEKQQESSERKFNSKSIGKFCNTPGKGVSLGISRESHINKWSRRIRHPSCAKRLTGSAFGPVRVPSWPQLTGPVELVTKSSKQQKKIETLAQKIKGKDC